MITNNKSFAILNQDISQDTIKEIGSDWVYVIEIIMILKEDNEFNIRAFKYRL